MNRTVTPRRRGFTLAEALITMTVSGLLLAGSLSAYMFLTKNTYGIGNYVDMNRQSRVGLELFGREVRQASAISNLSGTGFTITIPEGETSSLNITYSYDASKRALVREEGNSRRELLRDVQRLEFRYYNLLSNETTSGVEAKTLQLDAMMERKLIAVSNTNYVISARYMMRSKP